MMELKLPEDRLKDNFMEGLIMKKWHVTIKMNGATMNGFVVGETKEDALEALKDEKYTVVEIES